MKHFVFLLVALVMSSAAQAAGLLFAVESFEKAQALAKKDASMHVLVFYTSDN